MIMIIISIVCIILCIGVVFIFKLVIESINISIDRIEKKHKSESEVINHLITNIYNNIEHLKIEIFNSNQKINNHIHRIEMLENEVKQLRSGSNSRFY